MRSLLIIFLSIALLSSIASAELLTTAKPLGQGKWGVLGSGLQDSNTLNTSGYSLASLGGYVGYGLSEKLDLFVTVGSANVGGLPAGSISMTAYGATLKYTVLEEGEALPVSVAVGGGYKATTNKMTGLADASGSQIGAAVGISKLIVPFIPYGGLTYRRTAASGSVTQTQIDLTVGTAIAWSLQGAVFVEYTLQSITPNGGTAYSSPQIGAGVGYAL
ncbi:MAG: hypothetical protein ABIA67_00685 [Candidatus Margulisiibacteriota bacterium]